VKLDKKGGLRKEFLVLLVGMLLFGVFVSYIALAETTAEEKARLEAEMAELEQTLAVISAGLGQDFGGLLCGVDKIKYSDYKCEHIGFHVVKVLTVGVHNQRFNFSDFIADAHNLASLANVSTNGSVNQFVDDSDLVFDGDSLHEEVIKIKLRIEEIKERLKEL
jgi:hypothetical protein